jgi:hypothetical protein
MCGAYAHSHHRHALPARAGGALGGARALAVRLDRRAGRRRAAVRRRLPPALHPRHPGDGARPCHRRRAVRAVPRRRADRARQRARRCRSLVLRDLRARPRGGRACPGGPGLVAGGAGPVRPDARPPRLAVRAGAALHRPAGHRPRRVGGEAAPRLHVRRSEPRLGHRRESLDRRAGIPLGRGVRRGERLAAGRAHRRARRRAGRPGDARGAPPLPGDAPADAGA